MTDLIEHDDGSITVALELTREQIISLAQIGLLKVLHDTIAENDEYQYLDTTED